MLTKDSEQRADLDEILRAPIVVAALKNIAAAHAAPSVDSYWKSKGVDPPTVKVQADIEPSTIVSKPTRSIAPQDPSSVKNINQNANVNPVVPTPSGAPINQVKAAAAAGMINVLTALVTPPPPIAPTPGSRRPSETDTPFASNSPQPKSGGLSRLFGCCGSSDDVIDLQPVRQSTVSSASAAASARAASSARAAPPAANRASSEQYKVHEPSPIDTTAPSFEWPQPQPTRPRATSNVSAVIDPSPSRQQQKQQLQAVREAFLSPKVRV
jgi:hypothetical protein